MEAVLAASGMELFPGVNWHFSLKLWKAMVYSLHWSLPRSAIMNLNRPMHKSARQKISQLPSSVGFEVGTKAAGQVSKAEGKNVSSKKG